jgi:hypothetical protein
MYKNKQVEEAMRIVNQVFSKVQCDRATQDQLKAVENILNAELQKVNDGDIPEDIH